MALIGINSTWGAQEWSNYVLEHLATESVLLRSGCRAVPIKGRVAHIPRVLTDGAAVWTAEAAEIASSAPTGDELVLTPKKVANVVALSNESVFDAPISELEEVGNALTRSIAAALDTKALSADAATAIAPAGLLSLALTAQTGGATALDSYISAAGKIEAVGGVPSAIYLNASDMTSLRLIKTAPTGSNAYVLEPDAQAAGAEKLAGCTFYPTPALAAGTAVVAARRRQGDRLMATRKGNQVADKDPVETWTVRVTDDNTVAYGDQVYESGDTFDAPVAAVEQAVNRGMLERP